jgi:hypothetical protein
MFTILLLFVVHVTICRTPEQSYLITSDQFKEIKAYKYSIYDVASNSLQYRIESNFHLLQSLEVAAYPSKKIVDKLRSKFRFLKKYEANFEVYDDRYQRWIKGVISETHRREGKWKIQYDGHSLSIAHKHEATTYFFDEGRGMFRFPKKEITEISKNM